MLAFCLFFFFFKQKTAYDMRISDWSSDVCSSDLIWSLDGRLLGLSSGAPSAELADHGSGFAETVIDGQAWRVYAIEDQDRDVRVLVGDRLTVRERLVSDMITGLLLPAALILPALAFLIWARLGRGLEPLHRMAAAPRPEERRGGKEG